MENIWLWIQANHNILALTGNIGCLLLFIVLLFQKRKQKEIVKKLKAYESGSLNSTLEQEIDNLKAEIEAIKNSATEEKRKLTRFIAKEKKAIKKCKLIKYNAFETQGGNVSYALALLNEENSGVIINSIHSTDFSFSYAKQVVHGRVNQVLSKEEETVLEKAIEEREKLSSR